jgi:tetratricopeptide (TPR) repeat protein
MNHRGQPSFGGLLLSVFLLVAAVLVVYVGVCGHQFLMYDDEPHLVNNPRLNPVTWRNVGRFWVEQSYWGLYIPLSYTFFAAEASLAGQPLDPGVFHLGNLLLHLTCVLLIFAILRRLVRHDGAACAGALLFGLHPVQVESVAWISETRGLLSGMFSLLAIWQFDLWSAGILTCRRRLQSPSEPAEDASATGVASYNLPDVADASAGEVIPQGTRIGEGTGTSHRAGVYYVLATVAFVLALLSKPAAVAVPLIAAVLAVGLSQRPLRRILLGLGPWLLVAAGWALLTKLQQPSGRMAFVAPLWARPLIAGDALGFYLYELVGPLWYVLRLIWHGLWLPWRGLEPLRDWVNPQLYGPDYGRTPAWVIQQWWFYFTWFLPAAVLAALACLRNRRQWLTAAGVFVAGLLPVLGLLPFDFQRISTVADRYLYLPLLGPALAMSWFLAHRWNRRTIAVTAAILCLLAGLSFVQASYWRDNQTLIEHGLRLNPHSALAKQHQGTLLDRAGRHEEAIRWYRDLLKDDPQFEEAYINLTNSLLVLDRVEEAEKTLREALRYIPMRPAIHYKLAEILAEQGEVLRRQKKTDQAQRLLDDAERHYRRALQHDPQWASPYVSLGKLRFDRGATDEAIGLYRTALKLDPYDAAAHLNLAVALESQQKVAEARYHYDEALRILPDWPQAHFNLANLLRRQGALDAAERHYRAALESQPDYAKAHVELGIILFDRGAAEEAIRHYRAALRTDPKLVPAHVNLGHALAAVRRPKEAAAAYRAALQLVPADSVEAQQIRQFLRPYENR